MPCTMVCYLSIYLLHQSPSRKTISPSGPPQGCAPPYECPFTGSWKGDTNIIIDMYFYLCLFYCGKISQFSCSFVSICNPMDRSVPGFRVHHQLLKLAQTHVHRVGDAIQPSHPLLPPSPPAFNLSQHPGLFKRVSSSHQVAKVSELQLQHQSFQWLLGLISLRIDWFELLAVQGTLKSLLQHRSSKPSILPRSAFFIVQLSHPYMTTEKTIALTWQTFVSKAMSCFWICYLGWS